ncbi:MAG: hypothetical protein KKB51_02555 [Candidatus Riflebacteria bacterium]|nr:hypothetical protein [Candidatus Riflebacteria bacterium]
MASDNRKTDGRRESESESDRRRRNERRDADRRGKAERKPAKAKAPAPAKSRFNLKSFFKVVAALFMATLAAFSLIFIVFFGNLDYFMGKAGERLLISVDRVVIDPAHLTERSSKAHINLRIQNTLPLDVVLQSINFSMLLSNYTIAKDAAFMPKAFVKGNSVLTVPIWCEVDSIMMRRGLQKGLQKGSADNDRPAVPTLSSRNNSIASDIKNMTRIEGNAEFRLSAGGTEIPFLRRFVTGKR